ncbi:hypothetical protein CK203_054067 [Vitis vinifera]|uniref:Retrotransposon gag domain-containing protein n=1 Tax=Vitis vinifera TaxID=29760 RepID=A0A438GIM8_VITVI|nr:hypothetical protein CK203_054067 [Vitis vinifera]
MCGGDDHLAWKRPVSSEVCRGLRTVGWMSLDPLIRIPSSHVGASESLQSRFSHHLGLSSSLSWLGTPLHFVVTCWMLWDMFIDHIFTLFALITLSFVSFVELKLKVELRICGYRWSIDLVIAYFGLPPRTMNQFRSWLSLESHTWRRVGGQLIRSDSHQSLDSSVEMSDELAFTLTFIQEFMAGTAQVLPPGTSHGVPFHLSDHCETAPPPVAMVLPPIFTTTDDTKLVEQEARVKRLESRMRQIRLQDESLTWDDRDGIQRLVCPPIMRAHGIDDAQLVALFPMSLSGAAQRWFASVEPSRLRTWENVAYEFLTQFAFRADIDEAIARGLWTDTAHFLNSKGKKLVGLSSSIKYHPIYVQQPYIAQTSMQPRPPHPRVTTFLPPRPYTRRPARQFTPLGMTLTRDFEKLKDAGLIVPLAPRPLPHPIPPHFRSHEHCSFHQTQGHVTYYCSTLRNAIQDLIDTRLVNLSGPSVTVNPLPTHSTHAVEDLVQSTWVHHFAVVQLRVLLILIMVVIRVISVLLSPDFSSPWFFLFC